MNTKCKINPTESQSQLSTEAVSERSWVEVEGNSLEAYPELRQEVDEVGVLQRKWYPIHRRTFNSSKVS